MIRRGLAIAAFQTLACAMPASANDLYFHRAGAEWSQYEADVQTCVLRTARTQADMQTASAAGGGIYGAIGAAIGNAIVAGIVVHEQRRENLSHCMALRGWTAMDIDNLRTAVPEGETEEPQERAIDIDDLLDERIQAWFSQPEPPAGTLYLEPQRLVRQDIEVSPPITLETAIAEREARRRN